MEYFTISRLYKEGYMANGKFSQQVIQSQGLPSRSERRKQDELRRREDFAQTNFDQLQKKAKELQSTEFSNITSADQYRQKYNALSSDLQQFFITPEEVQQKIDENRDPELKKRESDNEARLKDLYSQLDSLNQRIADTKKQTGERPRSLVNEMTNVGNEIDDLKRQQQILKQSSTDTEAIQQLSFYGRQNTQALISSQERQKAIDTNKILREAEKSGSSFMKIEESKDGVPLGRKVYVVTPSGEYKLVSESKAQDVSKFKPSVIEKANISEVIRIGKTAITFQGVQDLYKTPQGKISTAYGSFDVSEDQFIKEQEEARRKDAAEYLAKQNYNPVITEIPKRKGVGGIWDKIVKETEILYRMTPLGSFSEIESEGNQKRQFLSLTKTYPIGINVLGLDSVTARELTEQKIREGQVGEQQIQAIQDLTKVVQGTPEELQYDVQQLGIEKLKNLGLNYVIDERTGELIFTSKEITPKKSMMGLEREKSVARGQSQIPLDLITIGLKGLEFFGAGEVIGSAFKFGKYGYRIIKGGVGLERGIQLTEVTIQGGKVIGTAEYVEQSALRHALGKVGGKVGKVVGYTAFGGLYALSSISEYYHDIDVYGKKVGTRLFLTTKIGEVSGFGALLGKSALENREIRRLRVEVIEGGTGKVVLSKSEKEIMQGIYIKQAGFSKLEAEKLIKEGAIYEQKLIVESPADFETFTKSRTGILSTVKTEKGFKEVAVEFTRNRGKISNAVIKTTTGTGKYGITSVFEKTRRSKELRELLKFGDLKFIKETPPTDQFRLKDVFISKIGKQGQVKMGDVKYIAAESENRLLKSISKKIKDRTTVEESLRSVKATYSEKELMEMFEGAGVSSRTSPTPSKVLRIEKLLYRDQGILKVNTDEEFGFIAAGRSGRQLSLRNIFKKLDFTSLEQALRSRKPKKTPFSKTFGDVSSKESEDLIKNVERQITKQRVRSKSKQIGVNISPTISAFKFNLRQTGATQLKAEVDVATKSASSVKSAIRELLGVRSISKVRQKVLSRERTTSVIKSKQVLKELLKQEQRQRQRQVPQLRSQPQLRLERITFIPEIPFTTTTPRIRPDKFIVGFGKDNKKLKNLIKLKKILKQDELAFLPSFTAKALDIPAIEVSSEKEALRLIKQIRTGFEVTGGIRIRR